MNLFPLIHSLYIDPGAVSIVLTSVVGVAIVIGTSITIWWRRTKKKVAKTLHIDENANKEVEEDLVINDEKENTASTEQGSDKT